MSTDTLSITTFASNWQLRCLKQSKGKNNLYDIMGTHLEFKLTTLKNQNTNLTDLIYTLKWERKTLLNF